ncbi:hypothetical protein [Paenibacillus sp. JCM 10914]|uniref:hypothetical protein n=1 Tax=Paenibacillus sp. JCM 10914 TaxID=1236974 RepID=UPI001E43ACDD|nr:hypothetical protein [Paenibacillus sp. JCM 10914]
MTKSRLRTGWLKRPITVLSALLLLLSTLFTWGHASAESPITSSTAGMAVSADCSAAPWNASSSYSGGAEVTHAASYGKPSGGRQGRNRAQPGNGEYGKTRELADRGTVMVHLRRYRPMM